MKSLSKIYFGLVAFLSLFLSACGSSGSNDEPTPVTNSRTVLVYMIADNSLGGRYDLADLEEMDVAARNGFPNGSRLLVYYCNHSRTPQLLEITAEGRQVLKSYSDEISSAAAKRMTEVIADTKKFAPARRYGMMFWSHASGWIEDGIEEPDLNLYSFGWDGSPLNAMNTTTLAKVLEGQGVDFAYFDCCYMGGVEVVYELRHAVETIMASTAELPANGSPYDKILPYLMREDADCVSAARITFDGYQQDYAAGIKDGCTLSVIRTSGLDALAAAVKEVYTLHPQLPSGVAVQEFQNNRKNYYDLMDYLSKLRVPGDETDQPLNLAGVEKALNRVMLYHDATESIYMSQKYPINAFCGLSTYIIRTKSDTDRTNYDHLAWYRDVASHLLNE